MNNGVEALVGFVGTHGDALNSSRNDRAPLHVDRSRSMVKNMQQLKALQQPLRV
jgi:hypothetical protein